MIKNKKLDVNNNIVLLTRENADIIEELINKDPSYFNFSKIIYEKYYNDFGKDAKRIMNDENQSLFALLRIIDVQNSTNVWRYKHNRENLNRMLDYMKDSTNNFFDELKKGNSKLPDILSSDSVGGTAVKSFSSKVCQFLSREFFGNDSYFKNDKFIRAALPFYLDYYGINHNITSKRAVDKLSYEELHKYLEDLRKAANKKHSNDLEISKCELDHIIWYCYKSFKA